LVGLDYYSNVEEELPESIRWTKMLLKMQSTSDDDDDTAILKPIDESILSYYNQKPILQWIQNDGIFTDTQVDFEIGFDLRSERITIPIRDEIGNLVGVKGRLYLRESTDKLPKYLYIEQCAKAQILYGLHKTYEFIKQDGFVIICESEKGVLQLWSQGYKNAVSIGGHKFSKVQIEKVTRLGVDVVVAFDKDVEEADVLQECAKFMDCINVHYLMDKDNLLEEKESPMDDADKFQTMMENNKYIFVRS
jgi:DNA primase